MPLSEIRLDAKDTLTEMLHSKGIATWSEALSFISKLPYGRNANRHDSALVISEMQGTCSSKHALLKRVATANNIMGVNLVLAIYKMSSSNTPGIGTVLSENQLNYIPEAHCFISLEGKRIDLTSIDSELDRINDVIIHEELISADQVHTYKVKKHKEFLRAWIDQENIVQSLEEIWAIREKCIHNLSISN